MQKNWEVEETRTNYPPDQVIPLVDNFQLSLECKDETQILHAITHNSASVNLI